MRSVYLTGFMVTHDEPDLIYNPHKTLLRPVSFLFYDIGHPMLMRKIKIIMSIVGISNLRRRTIKSST